MVKGILKGMALTLKYALLRKRVTVQYPFEKPRESPNFRAMHILHPEKCILCNLCAMACPNKCIEIKLKEGRERSRKLNDYDYIVDIGKCLWCGLCEEACPKKAVELGPEFELAEYDKDKFIRYMDTSIPEEDKES
ncbi:MAG: hypothetical protein A7316_05085 [Candidatus Altiarchaeales archaeon WOR_SM1_86-2]|nr:MAG: hypothetical protein A7315_11610 [Candidatus Altiarchaeales archaeon WOR_SM1_79]ODS39596.1 MAG: hypothetical protein A7316_05085 [Candidatus Altiarchaeales archaeon WOR_SM1_86-2]